MFVPDLYKLFFFSCLQRLLGEGCRSCSFLCRHIFHFPCLVVTLVCSYLERCGSIHMAMEIFDNR